MFTKIVAAWRWLPVLVRAPIVAFIVLTVGSTIGALPVFANTKFLPSVPWSLPASSFLMILFWLYFTGWGWPARTQAARRYVTRLKSLPWPIWRAAILPLLLSLITVMSFRLLMPSILPVEAPKISLDLSSFPIATVVSLLLSVALTAGIAEEVAFRGYLQKPLEDTYGPVPAFILTGIAFWFAHFDKVALSHLPFHLIASVLLGLTAYLSRSLLPSIIGHTLGDSLLLPAYLFHKPDFIWSSFASKPLWEGVAAATPIDKVEIILRAISPSALYQTGATQRFAILAWIFLLSLPLTSLSFIKLSRVVRKEWPHEEIR